MGAWIEIKVLHIFRAIPTVAPLVGAWIEIDMLIQTQNLGKVAPLVGAWIEIHASDIWRAVLQESLPSWERGLKWR